MPSNIKIVYDANFVMPKICFRRPGGERGKARLYLERVGGVWTAEQLDVLSQIYDAPPIQEPGNNESWFYLPNPAFNSGDEMNGVTYSVVLDVFSGNQNQNERTGAQFFKLPEPNVVQPFWVRTTGNETLESCVGALPPALKIEPLCWKTLFLGNSHRCAPLIVETTAHFRPLILKSSETSNEISNLFANESDGTQLSICLSKVLDDLILRVNNMSCELCQKKKSATSTTAVWKYTFPEDLYTCLNFAVNNDNLALVKWLQNRYVQNTRFVLPLRMALCRDENDENYVEDPNWKFNLEILPQTTLAGDVVVLDCGTSSCYGAFTHPCRTGLTSTPEEQAVCRCKELEEWLTTPTAPYRSLLDDLLLRTLDALEPNSPDRGNVQSVGRRLRAPNMQYFTLGGIFKFTKEFERQLRLQSENWVYADPMQLNPNQLQQREVYLEFIYKWYEIEKEVYETFSEISRNVQSATLNPNLPNGEKTIVSEFLFKEDAYMVPTGTLGSVDSETRMLMAKQEYIDRFGGFAPPAGGNNPTNALGNAWHNRQNVANLGAARDVGYYQNPKSQIYRIHHDKKAARIYQGFLNDALQRVLKEYRNINWQGEDVPNLALTYPATLSPMGRRKLRELAMQLGFPVVDTTCDESVAPAIFHLEKFCGGSPELGLESFKTRCVRIGNKWYHNMLIVDVGAGTTDVSLVQFELKEKFPNNAPTIPGGREYCVTPYLLATQGNPHLAGNYLTLTLFHYLRAFVALKYMGGTDDQLQTLNLSPNLTARVLDSGAARIKAFASENLPTDYMAKGITEAEFEKRYRRFNAFWDMAEKIKIRMSENQEKDKGSITDLPLDEVWDGQFFNDIDVTVPQANQGSFQTNLSFCGVVFDALQNALVQDEIVDRLAVELTKEALNTRKEKSPDLAEACKGVDSVILSGCSSRLPNLGTYLTKKIKDSATQVNGSPQPFATSKTRVFFEDKYAKSATALGTASVWNSIHRNIVTVDANPIVNLGFCASRIDVKNLVYYLSSSYMDAFDQTTYFKLQTKYVKDGLGVGEHFSIRSAVWRGFAQFYRISKQVGAIVNPPDYAEFDFNGFSNSANAASTEIAQETNDVVRAINNDLLRVRYEIDLEQDIYALVAQLATPADTKPKLFYTTKIKGIREVADYVNFGFKRPLPPGWVQFNNPGSPVLAGAVVVDGVGLWLPENACFDRLCLDLDGKKTLCCWSQTSFKPFATYVHTTTLSLAAPVDGQNPANANVVFNLDNYYQDMIRRGVSDEELRELELKVMATVDLDEEGNPVPGTEAAHIFVGDEPAYAETEDVKEWVKNPGLVYRKKITNETPFLSDEYNPFSGKH